MTKKTKKMWVYVDFLTNRYQGGAFHHTVAGGHADTGDLAVAFGGDVVFHLHGFKHENGLALLDTLSHGYQNLGHYTGQRCLHRSTFAGTGGRSGSRCSGG